jgi:hypothetical protein
MILTHVSIRGNFIFSMSDVTNPSTQPGRSSGSSDGVFRRWSRKFALVTGLGVTEEERLDELRAFQGKTCEKWKRELMTYSKFGSRPPLTFFVLTSFGDRSSSGIHAQTSRVIRMSCEFDAPPLQAV